MITRLTPEGAPKCALRDFRLSEARPRISQPTNFYLCARMGWFVCNVVVEGG